jgi:hypothetical protein
MHSKGGRESCRWLLRAVLLVVTRADMIGILVFVRSRFAQGMSSTRQEQFAERKCCVSRWEIKLRTADLGDSKQCSALDLEGQVFSSLDYSHLSV